MNSGTKTKVHIGFPNSMCGVFINRFGKEISFRKIDDNHSELAVNVTVSPQFFGWIFSLGKDIIVTGSDEVVEQLKQYAKNFMENYK